MMTDMLKRNLWLVLFLICLPVLSQRLTPEQTGGVYYAYPVVDAPRISIPNGLEVFYISHYGRHGSRWVDSKRRYKWTMSHFKDDSNLTELGKDVKRRLKVILRNARGNAGKLTPLGAEQNRQIARRMSVNYPEVFAEGAEVSAQSSVVPRCRNSMKAFCGELERLYPNMRIPATTKKRYMAYISYDSPELTALRKKTKSQPMIDTDRFLSSLFIDPSVVKNTPQFLYEFHTIASDMQDIPLDISLWDVMTYEEMMSVHDSNKERMTICHGVDARNHDIPARSALSLWKHIESEADRYIRENKHGASLLFGHDTPLFRLTSLLRLSLPGTGLEDIIPMGANLQFVFMKDSNSKVYVAFLHNEKQQFIPIEPTYPGIYKWDDVKRYVKELYGV